jgi:hypothetical protein
MDAIQMPFKRGRYNSYYKKPELLEPIFTLFLTEPDDSYVMREVSARSHIPLKTLYSWCEKVRTEPSWRPSREHFFLAPRALPPDVEETIADFVRVNFVSLGRSLTRLVLKTLILMLVQGLIAQEILDESILNFKCFAHFMSNFIRRMGLGFRKAHPERRPVIDDSECVQSLANLTAACHRYSPHLILNFDESNWHLVMEGDVPLAERGAETVHNYVDGDPKMNFTLFATITVEGTKFTLILVVKGKTTRCHGEPGQHDQFEHEIWHSLSGWCTAPLMQQHLHWVRAPIPGEPIRLIKDQFTVHTTDEVTETAEELGIEIIWLPKGATGKYHPLDRRTFGALKSKGRAKWKFIFS